MSTGAMLRLPQIVWGCAYCVWEKFEIANLMMKWVHVAARPLNIPPLRVVFFVSSFIFI
jgi:hypothetical protein